jgi:histidinol phosphatase-like enzyme (inositol monophosphatase family)
MSDIHLKELLNIATDAAHLGGRRALAYYNTGVEVERKRDNTPVTRADKESEQLIRDYIRKYHPTHSVVGEEHGPTQGDENYRWIIDPIDGTKSFITGVPLWGVLVGVEVRGVASVGVIYMPALEEMVAAARGLGCTWNSRRARVSEVATLADATLLTTSVTSCQKRSDAFDHLAAKARLVRNWGDCYGYVLVATGRADVMLDPAMNPWDSAPMLPILEEAGGRFTTWSGEPTIWGKDAVATNANLSDEVRQVLRAEKRRA